MELIIILVTAYVGGPLGALFMLIGAVGLFRKKQSWPTILLGVGAVILILAIYWGIQLANTNFGL